MRKAIRLALTCALMACALTTAGKTPAPLLRSRQMIVVTTNGWEAVPGVLRRFERKGNGAGAWSQVGAEARVVVGRNGLGWGAGLVDAGAAAAGPRKKEGDGKAPAGVFALGSAFGFAPERAAWLRFPYIPLTPSVECVDDTASRRYNLILDRLAAGDVGWNSSERMRSVEGYRWGLVVRHNAAPTVAGRGSCIFLHIWAGPERGTAGCTAMEEESLTELLRWLDPKKSPLLVQLPEGEYARLHDAWRLPPLDFDR
jgi:D-alanyl-D-alanine dipeptidase